MATMEGIHNIRPAIRKVSWPFGKIQIDLEDARSIVAPLKLYPSLKKLAPKFRKQLLMKITMHLFSLSYLVMEILHVKLL